MGKLIDYLIKILLLIGFFWTLSQSACAQNQPLTKREQVKQIYLSQIGIREATGRNDGKEVKMYLRSVGLGEGFPWCAAGVNWCFMEAGVPTCKSAWVPAWFPENRIVYRQGKVIQRMPTSGDCLGIWFSAKKRLAHIGFIHSWTEGKYAVCVEGNTNEAGSREGDGWYKKYRLKSQIHSVSNWIND